MTFPVSQSVLDPEALASAIAGQYNLSGDVRCRLISRGMNDIYRVDHTDGSYALKVARSGKSSDDEFEYEQAYIIHLAKKGLPVPGPQPTKDGSTFFTVEAPEGHRQLVLMAWLDGDPFPGIVDKSDAHRLGALLAKIHIAGADFRTSHKKEVATVRKIQERLPHLLDLLKEQPDECDFVKRVSVMAIDQFGALSAADFPEGPCHGDLQNANVMKQKNGTLSVFDFSDCGTDILAKDIAAFYWRNDFEGLPDHINQAFLSGYAEVRPLSPVERDAQPLFRVLRHLLITSTMAQVVNLVGPLRGFDESIGFYVTMIRKYGADACLL